MKTRAITLTMMLTAWLCASAQKSLGDYIEFDGIPSFIFFLDESGEHGLAMMIHSDVNKSTLKHMEKALSNLTEEQVMAVRKSMNTPSTNTMTLKKDKDMRPLYEELKAVLSDDGKANTSRICHFCEEKGLSLEEYFPAVWIAREKGEGWFIPGDNELKLFASFFCGGLGKEYALGIQKWGKQPSTLSENLMVRSTLSLLSINGRNAIYSSSLHSPKDGFRKLAVKQVSMPAPKAWFEIFDRVPDKTCVCYVHEF